MSAIMRIGGFIVPAVFGAALWLVALVAPAAQAQTSAGAPPPALGDTLAGDAKEAYEAGRRLYESGDYPGALAKFQSASRASGDPRLLWNAAVCERAMQHYARAVVLVRRYLDSHSRLITPEAAHNAQLFLDAAEPLTARLDVQSNERDAMVFVDDEPLGGVPLGPGARIDAGTHRVTVKKRDFNDYTVVLTVTGSAEVHVTAPLGAIVHQGRVVVRAGGADIIAVDGVAVGVGTWRSPLPSGPHSIAVTAPGSRPFEWQIVVAENQTRAIDLNAVDVTTAASNRASAPSSAGIPTWVWLVAGGVLAAGVITAGFVALKSPDPPTGPMEGSVGLVQLPLR
jgi:hypothetical protein